MKEFIDKLIEELEGVKSIVNSPADIVWNNAVKMCIYKAKELAEEYNGGWIPCSERLPEKGGSYILYSKTGSVYLAHYYKNSIVPHWSKNSGNIIAWMPLPAPYTEGE